MATGMLDIIKRAALDAVDNAKLTDLRFGTVISSTPLKVRVTNQFILTEQMLIVPEHLTDHEVEVSVTTDYAWKTKENDAGISVGGEVAKHDHEIEIAIQKLKLHQGLKVGDKVALLRKQGGQSYFILDRLQG